MRVDRPALLVRLGKIGRLWRTVRHLRAEQLWGRLWFRLHHPSPDLRPAPPLRGAAADWATPARRDPSLVGPQCFEFLNVSHTLSDNTAAWDDPQMERLWRYNLHYFDDLNATAARQRKTAHHALMARWIAENPPGVGSGWEPYPSSLRIVNWIKWFVGGTPVNTVWLDSLAVQVRWLCGRLEWHLLGNHLFVNAKALMAAGLYFEGAEADRWLKRGLSILRRELSEQILSDGGQFERSPMYQALALEDLLDLINLVQARASPHSPARALLPELRERGAAMLHWMRCMTLPNGTLAHFNDSADGIAPSVVELERYAAALGLSAAGVDAGVVQLRDSGYIRATFGNAVLVADVAPLGPNYLVGHAHADTLSFELSLGAQPLLVNGGTSRYGLGPQRLQERGTAAHNTVQVDGQDSSEVWSGFRVGRRARPRGLQVQADGFSCAHDGYRHLPGAPEHHRSWSMQDGVLQIDDRLQPAAGHAAVARYRLAPGLQLHREAGDAWSVRSGPMRLARVTLQRGRGRKVASRHAPRFGVTLPTDTLEVELQDGVATTRWSWSTDAHPLSD